MKKDSLFWVGYSDLLTSLFFVMLVLFSITFLHFKQKNQQLNASVQQLKQIKKVEKALQSLDEKYFEFDSENKRYKLKIDVEYKRSGQYEISDLRDQGSLVLLKKAGIDIYNKVAQLIKDNPDIEYLLVIEGNAARYQENWIRMPNEGYKLSYKRALALFNFWKKDCNIPFNEIEQNCEMLIAGSGYFGQSREEIEKKNKRFTIQVTSKVGKFLNKKQE